MASGTVRKPPRLPGNVVNIADERVKRLPENLAPVRKGGGGGNNGDGPSKPSATERKRKNKRHNEQLKLFGSFMNTMSMAVIGGAIIAPLISDAARFIENYTPVWFLTGVALHIAGQWVFFKEYRSEE